MSNIAESTKKKSFEKIINDISLMKIMLDGKAVDIDLEPYSATLGSNNFDDWREKFITNIKKPKK